MPENNGKAKGGITGHASAAATENAGDADDVAGLATAASGIASSGGGATSSTHGVEVPSWVKVEQRLRWWSESLKKFMAVRVSKIDEKKRVVIVVFEADAKVWKSVPFSHLGRRSCPLQKGEESGQSTERKKNKERHSSAKDKGIAIKKDHTVKENSNKDSTGRESLRKDVASKEGPIKEPSGKESSSKEPANKEGASKEAEEDGTATPNWWLMEKARLMNSTELEKKEKEDQERRKREKEEQELRLEEQRRLEILAAERRKVEEAFEMRKREAEELKLKEEEEWRSQLRKRREREAAEEEERERERELRRKKRQEEKGRKRGKEEAEERKKKEAEDLKVRHAAEEAARRQLAEQALRGLAVVQPWAAAAAGVAWDGATAAHLLGVAPQGVPGAPVVVPPRAASATPLGAWGHFASTGVAGGHHGLASFAAAAGVGGPRGLSGNFGGLKAASIRPLQAGLAGHALLQQGVPPGAAAAAAAQAALLQQQGLAQQQGAVGGWGQAAGGWGQAASGQQGAGVQGLQGEQEARELLHVLQAHGCVAGGGWGSGQTGWSGT